MRTGLAIAVAVLQMGVLAYMAGEREWVLRTGQIIHLRTAPIDPNDPMRGDYLRLSYEISDVPRDRCCDEVAAWLDRPNPPGFVRDERVYATLEVGADGLADVVALSDRPPSTGPFLRGRAEWLNGRRSVRVRYGIEAFFMEQKRAAKFEEQRRKEKDGVPLDMAVALSPAGLVVLKGYQWEPLGLTIAVDRRASGAEAGHSRPITGLTVRLKNHGAEPVAIVDLPQGRSFRLVPNEQWGENTYRWVGADAPAPKPEPAAVIVLAPGASHSVYLDFTSPEWFVVTIGTKAADKEPVPLEKLGDAWGTFFRVEYWPPSPEDCAELPNASLIYRGHLRSRTFSPAGAGLD